MPCNSDYLAQTGEEAQQQRAAKLLVYILERQHKTVPADIRRMAAKYYAEDNGQVPMLCEELRNLPPSEMESIVYNARDKTARDLADWWEEHQAADIERIHKENKTKRKEELREAAKAKLTPEELSALEE